MIILKLIYIDEDLILDIMPLNLKIKWLFIDGLDMIFEV